MSAKLHFQSRSSSERFTVCERCGQSAVGERTGNWTSSLVVWADNPDRCFSVGVTPSSTVAPVTDLLAVHWRSGPMSRCGYCGVDLRGRLYNASDRSEWVEERNACWAIGAGRPVTVPEAPRGEPTPGPTDEQRVALDEAQAIATRYDARLAQLRGKNIRVLRAIVYEGPAEAVLAQLAKSMALGAHRHGIRTNAKTIEYAEITITVIDDGALKIIE